MDTAKLFQSGRSQAVRLPKQYRFDGKEVAIKRLGSAVLPEARMTEESRSLRISNGKPSFFTCSRDLSSGLIVGPLPAARSAWKESSAC